MKVFALILFIFIFFKINTSAQGPPVPEDQKANLIIPAHIKNQQDLAKYQVVEYLKHFPNSTFRCALYLSRLSTYHVLLRNQGTVAFKKAFKINSLKRIPSTENQFSFSNHDVSEVCERDFGFCHGFSAALTYWNRLAHFDPENVNHATYSEDIGSDEWFDYYRVIIDELMYKRNPVIVPGFKHLYDFTNSHPRITRYMKEHVALNWAKRNINISNFFKILKSVYHTFTTSEALILHQKLSYRINELAFNPIVWISSESNEEKKIFSIENDAGIHTMQAYKITPIDANGNYEIHFWDIYDPHDAQYATRVFTISTNKVTENGRAYVTSHKENKQGKIIASKKVETTIFSFADMDLVPFDDQYIGEDAYKLLEFYKKNSMFTSYLENQYEEYLKNPPPPFRVPYSGPDTSPFEIILSDGSVWKVPTKYQHYQGSLYIEPKQVNELSNTIKKSLDFLVGKKWRKGVLIPRYAFQKAEPFYYLDSNGNEKTFYYDIKWFNYEGKFLPDNNFYRKAPIELIKELKTYSLQWPFGKNVSLKYNYHPLNEYRIIFDGGKVIWKVPIDFLSEEGFFVPANFKKHVPAKMIIKLKNLNLWEYEKPINLAFIDPDKRTLSYSSNKKFIIPLDWYIGNTRMLKITIERFNQLPDELKVFFTGYKDTNLLQTIEVDSYALTGTQYKWNNKNFTFPITWFDLDIVSEGLTQTLFDIPEEEIPFIPDNLKELIVGKNGTWPPVNKKIHFHESSLYLKDGSKFTWPMSWVDDGWNLVIPPGEEHVVPAKVINEIFSIGPYLWPLRRLSVALIQYSPIKLNDGSYWLWPREWMDTNFGIINLPKSEKKINEMIPLEVQAKIKKLFEGVYPKDRKFNVWQIADDFFQDAPMIIRHQ